MLTRCRILHTLDTDTVTSKQAAARWSQGALDARWDGPIAQALAWRKDSQQTPDGGVEETVALIQHTDDLYRQWETEAPPARLAVR